MKLEHVYDGLSLDLLRQIDTSGDGRIQFEEFEIFLKADHTQHRVESALKEIQANRRRARSRWRSFSISKS